MNKEECWEYYQGLLKQNGFDGITDLLSKYHELQNMVDEANTQEPVGVVETVGGYPDDSEHIVEWLVKYEDLKNGDKIYLHPILATQSPNITDPTELELHRADYRAIKSAGFESPSELLAAYKHLLSHRVTEQDALVIAQYAIGFINGTMKDALHYAENFIATDEGHALLDKLNKMK